jgi:hypothetical protein
MKTGRLIIFFILILFTIQISSCRSTENDGNPVTPSPYTIWFSNPREYHTNVLAIAQAETPFTIILPTYLPEELDPYPDIEGRAKSEFVDLEPVTITYSRNKSGYLPVSIMEYNMTMITTPSSDYEFEYLLYWDIQVLEKKTKAFSFHDSTAVDVLEFIYKWNQNGLHYIVCIPEFDREEARKIIESMIR